MHANAKNAKNAMHGQKPHAFWARTTLMPPPPPCSPPPLGRAELRRPWGPRNSLPPSEGAGRGVPRGPRSVPRIAATLRIAGRATQGMYPLENLENLEYLVP